MLTTETINRFKATCELCGTEWHPQTTKPLACVHCKRRDWNKIKKETDQKKITANSLQEALQNFDFKNGDKPHLCCAIDLEKVASKLCESIIKARRTTNYNKAFGMSYEVDDTLKPGEWYLTSKR